MESARLVEQDMENYTENFGRSLLGCTAINCMMKCDWKETITYKFYKNEYTLYSKMLLIYSSVDPTAGFEHLW